MDSSDNSPLFLRQALAGDQQAWDLLFEHLWPIVVSVISSKCRKAGGDALVDDIAQDVFVRLASNNAARLRQYSPERGMLESYVARIAQNCCIDFFRSNSKHSQNIEISSLPEAAVDDSEPPLPMLEEWEMFAAFQTLTLREKQTVNLLYKQELEVSEAAELMRISTETVRSLKSHAIRKLKFFFGQA